MYQPALLERWMLVAISLLKNDSNSAVFRVGIVGHRYLANTETVAFVAATCLGILREQQAEHKNISALSALAEGSDTLFAEAAVALNIRLEIVRPFEEYATDFTDPSTRQRYERLRSVAYSETRLAHASRSDAAYIAAMHWIVDNSSLLVAVWDGSPARGSGGTGDATARANLINCDWIHMNVTGLSVSYHSFGNRGK